MIARLSSKRILLLLVLSIFCLLVCHHILIIGKHGDGVEYACVAQNLAEGWGTFWKPYLSETLHKVHHEHPPLIYWIQSWFFRWIGNGPYIEGIYGFIVSLVILFGFALFWQRVRCDEQLDKAGSWWPVLLLISLPVITYMVQTNRHVVTFLPFAIFATYFSYLSISKSRIWLLHALLAGVLIYLGGIAKGPVALFSLAVPAIGWLTLKVPLSRSAISTAVALVTCATIFLGTAYLYPESLDFWKGFWQAQIVASLTNERAAGTSYFHYFERWITQMIVPFALTGFLMLIIKEPFRRIRINRQVWFFLLIALAGALPFLASKRQHIRYILHSFPFFILSFAFLTDRIAIKTESLLERKQTLRKAIGIAALLLFAVSLVAMIYREGVVIKREPFYNDLYLRDIHLPERIIVSVYPEQMIYDDLLFTDMQRFYRISVTGELGHDYLLIDKDSDFKVPEGYEKVHKKPTEKYILYKRIQQ